MLDTGTTPGALATPQAGHQAHHVRPSGRLILAIVTAVVLSAPLAAAGVWAAKLVARLDRLENAPYGPVTTETHAGQQVAEAW